MNMKEISDWVRKRLTLPPSEEPLPDLSTCGLEAPNKEVGEILWKPSVQLDTFNDFVNGTAYMIPAQSAQLGGWVSYKIHYTTSVAPHHEFKSDSSPFETNMMEALIGWRAWRLDLKKRALRSQNDFFSDDEKHLLRPGKPMTAYCAKSEGEVYARPSVWDPAGEFQAPPPHPVPAEFCTCGIYAKNTLEDLLEDYQGIYAQVYGWGRYVRGTDGWRAQYMYPKRFYMTRDYAREVAPETIDFLREYRVPIYVEQPVLLYNPEEDGYEHRDDEENWNFGASSGPDAEED